MSPKVSIIIPAYNTGNYIARAVKSTLEQTEQNVEVIVVDDASTDATVEVVKGFSDKRLKLLINERNCGPSYARNRAIKEARGEWIALLDSDDWYAPKRLERLLHVADAENADLVADDVYLIEEGAENPWSTQFSEHKVRFDESRQIDAVDFIDLNLSTTKPLIKRNFMVRYGLEFNESMQYWEDLFLYLMCLLRGARFIVVPEPYYFYRSRQGSLVTDTLKFFQTQHDLMLFLLQQESIKNNLNLAHSISRRLPYIEQNLAYYRVKQLFKEGSFLNALTESVFNRRFFSAFLVRFPQMLNYRFRRHSV